MKAIHIFTMATSFALLTACGESSEAVQSTAPEEPAAATVTSVEYMVDAEQSNIEWAGTKIIGGGHNGTIGIKKGMITVEEGTITSGVVYVDMSTISNSDLESEEEAAKLVGHLSSPDFFDVATYPMATFTVTKHAEGELGGNLKMKDAEREISFPLTMRETDGVLKASGTVTIDRTQWDVRYGSSLADASLGDNIDITFNLVANTK